MLDSLVLINLNLFQNIINLTVYLLYYIHSTSTLGMSIWQVIVFYLGFKKGMLPPNNRGTLSCTPGTQLSVSNNHPPQLRV